MTVRSIKAFSKTEVGQGTVILRDPGANSRDGFGTVESPELHPSVNRRTSCKIFSFLFTLLGFLLSFLIKRNCFTDLKTIYQQELRGEEEMKRLVPE